MDPESSHNLVKTIRLGPAEIERVICEMDDLVSWQTGGYRQANASMPAVRQAVLGVMNNGALTRYEVFIRSVGRRGAAVLHGSFLQALPGCTLMIITKGREPMTVPVRVRHCELFSGRIHELYLEFGSRMDMETLAKVQADRVVDEEHVGNPGGVDLSGFDDATVQIWKDLRELTEDMRDAMIGPGTLDQAGSVIEEMQAAWQSHQKAVEEAAEKAAAEAAEQEAKEEQEGAAASDAGQENAGDGPAEISEAA